MEFSQKAYDFAKIVIDEFGAPYKRGEIEKQTTEIEEKYRTLEEQSREPTSIHDKYSLDYDKKFDKIDEEEEKQKELNELMKTSPYLQAMGCSHDRRKV